MAHRCRYLLEETGPQVIQGLQLVLQQGKIAAGTETNTRDTEHSCQPRISLCRSTGFRVLSSGSGFSFHSVGHWQAHASAGDRGQRAHNGVAIDFGMRLTGNDNAVAA